MRPLGLAAAALFTFTLWVAWGVAHPAVKIITIYEPYIEVPVLFEPAPPVIAPQQPPEQAEQLHVTSATSTMASSTTTLVEQTPVGPSEVTFLEFAAVIATTWWPPAEWGHVWTLGGCESPTGDPETVGVHLIGDEDLVPRDGPSLGFGMVNIRAHAEKLLRYNLLKLRDNLLAMWEIWRDAGQTFIYDWKNCSEWRGLP